MNIASYIANSQTAPASTELGTAQLQLVSFIPKPMVRAGCVDSMKFYNFVIFTLI